VWLGRRVYTTGPAGWSIAPADSALSMPGALSNLLDRWKHGDAGAGEQVVAQTYAELRRLAHAYLRRERHRETLQTTGLLHEAYLRLLRHGPGTADTRQAFFRLMAAEMRRRLVDHARRRQAERRGGGAVHEPLRSSAVVAPSERTDGIDAALDRLDAALVELDRSFPRAAKVVQLRFLAGLTTEEAAEELGLSPGTVKRDWTFARAWLAAAMRPMHLPSADRIQEECGEESVMAHTYDELRSKTIAELREIAKDLHHDALQGYTQMNKEHLLPAICRALGIDAHHHHHHAPGAVVFDKSAARTHIRTLKDERDKAIEAGDHGQLKVIRRQIHTLKHRLRLAT
jgi:RNA polymerase sigma factor (TIGR02999 family)